MKIKIIKKVSLIILILTLFNVMMPITTFFVYAEEEQDKNGSILNKSGGVLLNAIKDLVVFLADSALQLMQETMINPQPILVTTDTVERNTRA